MKTLNKTCNGIQRKLTSTACSVNIAKSPLFFIPQRINTNYKRLVNKRKPIVEQDHGPVVILMVHVAPRSQLKISKNTTDTLRDQIKCKSTCEFTIPATKS